MKWLCAQIGAREHYAVPRVLHRDKRLAALYTDYWAGRFSRAMARGTNVKLFRSLATRFHPDLAAAPVTSWNIRSLGWETAARFGKNGVAFENFITMGASFASCVRHALSQRGDLDSNCIFYSYDTGALEALEWCRARGIKCVVNQMDPNRVEVQMVQEEEKRWEDWPLQPLNVPEAYFQRREKEWALADRVVVNSDFCRQALIRQNVPPEKLEVVPLCFEGENSHPGAGETLERKREPGNTLRVLFLGQVILRKGIQYLMQAAKLLDGENVRFDVVGPVGLSRAAVASAPSHFRFHGRATRDRAREWYRDSDVFVLPTLSDGFAITQLEAMSYGLPVIDTPCCGAVVSDGADGFIVPPRDAHALAKAIQRYLVEPELLSHQSHAALAKVRQFTLNHLAANLLSLERTLAH